MTAGAPPIESVRPLLRGVLHQVFGYHELFHALTLVALAFQYVAITFFVIRPA